VTIPILAVLALSLWAAVTRRVLLAGVSAATLFWLGLVALVTG